MLRVKQRTAGRFRRAVSVSGPLADGIESKKEIYNEINE